MLLVQQPSEAFTMLSANISIISEVKFLIKRSSPGQSCSGVWSWFGHITILVL